jgi:hypothetical protein
MLVNGFVCEGPRCTKGADGHRLVIHWAADDPTPPDAAHRMIVAKPAYEEPSPEQNPTGQPREHTFCGPKCLRDFFSENNYTEPRSPRELDVIRQANADAERKRNKEKEDTQ